MCAMTASTMRKNNFRHGQPSPEGFGSASQLSGCDFIPAVLIVGKICARIVHGWALAPFTFGNVASRALVMPESRASKVSCKSWS